jgi:hypothetical protein
MFQASSCPFSGATSAAVAAFGLPSELGDSSAVRRGSVAAGPKIYEPTYWKKQTHFSCLK